MNTFLNPVDHSLASNWVRFANLLIDYVFIMILLIILGILLALFGLESLLAVFEIPIVGNLVGVLIYFLCMFAQEAFFKGRSVGKFITGTQAVMLDGSEPTMNAIFVRNISRCVPFEAFSFFGTTGWHDEWSKTRVVHKKDFEQNSLKFNAIDQIGAES